MQSDMWWGHSCLLHHPQSFDRRSTLTGRISFSVIQSAIKGWEPVPFRRHRQGAALLTSLWISVVLLVLAIAYLTLLSSDYHLTALEGHRMKALYLARAGLEYYVATNALPPADASSKEYRLYLPAGQHTEYCVIEPDSRTGGHAFKGTVAASGGRIIARRVIVCPDGDTHQWYERK